MASLMLMAAADIENCSLAVRSGLGSRDGSGAIMTASTTTDITTATNAAPPNVATRARSRLADGCLPPVADRYRGAPASSPAIISSRVASSAGVSEERQELSVAHRLASAATSSRQAAQVARW